MTLGQKYHVVAFIKRPTIRGILDERVTYSNQQAIDAANAVLEKALRRMLRELQTLGTTHRAVTTPTL
jgi:hypothetical protein